MTFRFYTDRVDEGHWLGGYRLIRRLGVGGTGTVWLAQDEGGMNVALKLLHPAIAANEHSRQRLMRETRTVNAVLSDGVAHVVDVEVDDVQPFIVSEFIDGPTLAELLRESPLEVEDALDCAKQLYAIISAVHRAGVIHRDIKPGNIIMSETGPVLIDFGIARASEDVTLTAQGFVSATASYASPELLRGVRADEASDWWAWSATVLHMLTGRLPFGSGATEAVMNRVLQGQPDTQGLPATAAQILRGALSADPATRCAPEEILSMLASAADSGVFDDEDATTLLATPPDYAPDPFPPSGTSQAPASDAYIASTRLLGTAEPETYKPEHPATTAHIPDFYSPTGPSTVTPQWALPEEYSSDENTPAAWFGRPAPTPTPFVLLSLTAAAAMLPIFLGLSGLIVSSAAMLLLSWIGALNRGVRHRRVMAGGKRPTDWWVAAVRAPLTIVGSTLKVIVGWGMGLLLATMAGLGAVYGAPQLTIGRFYVDFLSIPGVVLSAQTRPAIAEVTGDPYAASALYGFILITFGVAAFFPTGVDLREGVALPVRALLSPWWARALFVVLTGAAIALTWKITVNALVFSV